MSDTPEPPENPQLVGLRMHRDSLQGSIENREKFIKGLSTEDGKRDHETTLANEKRSLANVNARIKTLEGNSKK